MLSGSCNHSHSDLNHMQDSCLARAGSCLTKIQKGYTRVTVFCVIQPETSAYTLRKIVSSLHQNTAGNIQQGPISLTLNSLRPSDAYMFF